MHIFTCVAAVSRLLSNKKKLGETNTVLLWSSYHYDSSKTINMCPLLFYPVLTLNELFGHFSPSLVFPGPEFCQMCLWESDLMAFIDLGNSRMKTCFSQVSFSCGFCTYAHQTVNWFLPLYGPVGVS